MKEKIHSYSVGDIVRVCFTDGKLEPGQWFEARVRAVTWDRMWLDISGFSVCFADANSTEGTWDNTFNVYFSVLRSGLIRSGCQGNFGITSDPPEQMWADFEVAVEKVGETGASKPCKH
jgi:hypothetical protein